jgi:hypothetical protein
MEVAHTTSVADREAFRLVLPPFEHRFARATMASRELKDAMALPSVRSCDDLCNSADEDSGWRQAVGYPIAGETFRFRRFAETTLPTTGIVGRQRMRSGIPRAICQRSI